MAGLSCRATRDGDEWVITGQKMRCTFVDGADYILLFARTEPTDGQKRRRDGISCFLIEKPRGELPTGVRGSPVRKIAYRG